jgi:hypothetical protein
MSRFPPVADKRLNEMTLFPLWTCLSERSQTILRSHCSKRWRPPTFHFITYNIGAIRNTDEGDFRNKRQEAKVPSSDRYHEVR